MLSEDRILEIRNMNYDMLFSYIIDINLHTLYNIEIIIDNVILSYNLMTEVLHQTYYNEKDFKDALQNCIIKYEEIIEDNKNKE